MTDHFCQENNFILLLMIETHLLNAALTGIACFSVLVETHLQSSLFMINRLVNKTNKNLAPVINRALSVRASLGIDINFFFQENCLLKELTTDQSRVRSFRQRVIERLLNS